MAQPKTRNKPRSASRISPFIILVTLSVITIITTLSINHFLGILKEQPQETVPDEQVERLLNDLPLATTSFNRPTFPLHQIFGDKPIWGSLNSGHYFGLKLSSPGSLETSLMWFNNQLDQDNRLRIRHLCDQNDGLKTYGWTRHDFYTFGEQIIEDGRYRLFTSFIKQDEQSLGFEAQISVEFLAERLNPISILHYVAINRKEDSFKTNLLNSHPKRGDKVFGVEGYTQDVGEFSMDYVLESDPDSLIYVGSHSGFVDHNKFTIANYFMQHMRSIEISHSNIIGFTKKKLPIERTQVANIQALQLVFTNSSTFRIKFNPNLPLVTTEVNNYDALLDERRRSFDDKFKRTFPLEDLKLKVNMSEELIDKASKLALSNMIGSIGYFYGLSFVSNAQNPNKVAPYGPIQLLTAVPSRSFFPRGFLWDEGFHNLVISRWDPSISNKIIESWYSIMNINGWIPREVILGLESMRRVPQEFLVQRITDANPPSMFLALEEMLNSETLEESTLESIYPKLKQWYIWFNTTQKGPQATTYRWLGRDELSVTMLNPKTLASGLDDYPRASHPSPLEYHVDLRCWMALASRTLAKISKRVHDIEFETLLSTDAQLLSDNELLNRLHWSDKHRMYCDFGFDTARAELVWVTKTRQSQSGRFETYRVLERHSTGKPEFGCVPEFGYVSLFPFLFKLLDPESDKLGILLDRLSDPEEVWSPYGIRSLSKSSRYYNKYNTEHDKPYWRGAIWMNLNYLILTSLKHYSQLEGPFKDRSADLFIGLKENIVFNVLDEFSKSNYFWENYDDQTGRGRGSHPFNGWSSLTLLKMSSYLD